MQRSSLPRLQRLLEASYELPPQVGQGADCWGNEVLAIQRVKNGRAGFLRFQHSMLDQSPESSIDARL
jgi:hypothetical protein